MNKKLLSIIFASILIGITLLNLKMDYTNYQKNIIIVNNTDYHNDPVFIIYENHLANLKHKFTDSIKSHSAIIVIILLTEIILLSAVSRWKKNDLKSLYNGELDSRI